MHFLFISSVLGPTTGGTETLIARMSKWLLNNGHQVTLLATNVRESRDLFHKELRIIEVGDGLFEYCYYHKARRLCADLQVGKPDVIKVFDLTSAWIATVLSTQMRPEPKVVFGNYIPYLIPKSRNPIKDHTAKLKLLNLRRGFADNSIVCMTEEQITEFRRYYGQQRKPIFWPLPVEDPSQNGITRAPKWGRIVSVGRLEPMKEYNLYMIDVVASLRKKGLPVTWSVYGDGVLSDAMKSRISALGLGDAIELKGRIPYSRFAEALQDAYLFVGMGTAIIEAALCGVPGPVALAYEKTGLTYGPLYRFAFGNAGELSDAPPNTTIETEIERMLRLPSQAYEEEVNRTRDYARRYEMNATMERFLEIAGKATTPKISRALFYWYYLDSLMNRILKKAPPGASPDYFCNGSRLAPGRQALQAVENIRT